MVSSCQDAGQEELSTQGSLEVNKQKQLSEYEVKLRELTLFMGEVFKDPEARRELFELAKANEHEEDISYSLKKLLRTNENPVSRKRSAIVSAFYENAKNHRALGETFDEKKLIDFINSNDISMLAPYMIGYFEPDKISELTVSWWTEEMEIEALKIDPNWKGETPGYKLKLSEVGNFVSFGKNNPIPASELVYANDDYAEKNPTVVFGRFDDPELIETKSKKIPMTENLAINSTKITCSSLDSTKTVVIAMPHWRLTSSVRSWPHNNRMHLWFVFGDLSNLPVGQTPTVLQNNITKPMSGNVTILRRHANEGRWQTSGPILVHNMPYEAKDFWLVWAVERPSTSFSISGSVEFSKKGIKIPIPSFSISHSDYRLIGDSQATTYINFQRCRVLNDNFNLIGDSFNGDGSLLTRSVGGEEYPVITQDVVQFILRIRQ